MASLANAWADARHDVSIVTLADPASDDYRLDARVRRYALAMMAESRSAVDALGRNARRIRALRSRIRSVRPDVVVSFNGPINVLVLFACIGLGVPVIVSERAYPPAEPIGPVWTLLRRLSYRFADAVVVQTDRVRPWARAVVPDHRIHVIPNAVNAAFVASEDRPPDRARVVLGVGRLVAQKGFDLLIRAFGAIASRYPDWSLTIVGRGGEEDRLRALAAVCTPPGVVTFPGAVADPERYYRSAGLFVLPSRFEGFPNVLLEAMASGCAAIAADCPAGPAEIVRNGFDGVLVPPGDIDALARDMARLMDDAAERDRLGANARQVAMRFGSERIMGLWGDVINRVRE